MSQLHARGARAIWWRLRLGAVCESLPHTVGPTELALHWAANEVANSTGRGDLLALTNLAPGRWWLDSGLETPHPIPDHCTTSSARGGSACAAPCCDAPHVSPDVALWLRWTAAQTKPKAAYPTGSAAEGGRGGGAVHAPSSLGRRTPHQLSPSSLHAACWHTDRGDGVLRYISAGAPGPAAVQRAPGGGQVCSGSVSDVRRRQQGASEDGVGRASPRCAVPCRAYCRHRRCRQDGGARVRGVCATLPTNHSPMRWLAQPSGNPTPCVGFEGEMNHSPRRCAVAKELSARESLLIERRLDTTVGVRGSGV
jgi:hypothetical protein